MGMRAAWQAHDTCSMLQGDESCLAMGRVEEPGQGSMVEPAEAAHACEVLHCAAAYSEEP